MYMTTRVRENNETLVCSNPGDGSCRQTYAFDCDPASDAPFEEDSVVQGVLPDEGGLGTCTRYAQRIMFTSDIERFTLLFEHSVQSSLDPTLGVREFLRANSSFVKPHVWACCLRRLISPT